MEEHRHESNIIKRLDIQTKTLSHPWPLVLQAASTPTNCRIWIDTLDSPSMQGKFAGPFCHENTMQNGHICQQIYGPYWTLALTPQKSTCPTIKTNILSTSGLGLVKWLCKFQSSISCVSKCVHTSHLIMHLPSTSRTPEGSWAYLFEMMYSKGVHWWDVNSGHSPPKKHVLSSITPISCAVWMVSGFKHFADTCARTCATNNLSLIHIWRCRRS